MLVTNESIVLVLHRAENAIYTVPSVGNVKVRILVSDLIGVFFVGSWVPR
jgi:hypothetical protein